MPSGGINFGGTDKELNQKLDKLAKEYPDATLASLYQEGFAIIALSKRKTPVRTGRLRSSAYVAPPENDGVECGYGTDYALKVHESTEASFTVGEAKFLENAVNERMDGWSVRLGKRIVENAKAGLGIGGVQRPPDIPETPEG